MSNLEKWIKAILNEDANKLSIGSVRTLQMIKQEFASKDKDIAEAKNEIERLKDALKYVKHCLGGLKVAGDSWESKAYDAAESALNKK